MNFTSKGFAGDPAKNIAEDKATNTTAHVDKGFSWTVGWNQQDEWTQGTWCYMRTYLPAKYDGGILMIQE